MLIAERKVVEVSSNCENEKIVLGYIKFKGDAVILRRNNFLNAIQYIILYVSHLLLLTLKALPRQWVALETANLQSIFSRLHIILYVTGKIYGF